MKSRHTNFDSSKFAAAAVDEIVRVSLDRSTKERTFCVSTSDCTAFIFEPSCVQSTVCREELRREIGNVDITTKLFLLSAI